MSQIRIIAGQKIKSCWWLDVLKKETGTFLPASYRRISRVILIEKLWSAWRHGTHLAPYTLYSMKINP